MKTARIGAMLASVLLLGAAATKVDATATVANQAPVARGEKPTERFSKEIARAKATMMTAPEEALAHARLAAAMSAPSSVQGLTAAWLEGEALFRSRSADQALAILDRASQSAARLAPNSRLQGDLLKARGQANGALGRVQDAMVDYQEAYRVFQQAKEARSEAITLQLIGGVYQQAHDDTSALKYYSHAAETYSADAGISLSLHNNRGIVLRDIGQFDEARAEFIKALRVADSLDSDNLRAQILTNLASTAARSRNYAQAKIMVEQGLALARPGSEAASERPFLLGVAANAALGKGDASAAVRILDNVFKGVDLTGTPAEYRDIHDTAAKAYEALGDTAKALAHHKALKRLDDLTQSLAASASAALVAARFDFANQDLRISRLKEGQLERDMSLARSKERLRSVIILAITMGGIIVSGAALIGFLYMRRSRNDIRAGRDQLAVANRHLEKALSAKTEFLAMASHEMRTPLNGILGITQVLLAKGRLEEETRGRVSLVQSAGEAMKELVDDLLDVAKTESASIGLVTRQFGLRNMIEDAKTFWQDKAAAKHLTVLMDINVPEQALGDPARLKQLVHNLLSNAIKFTESGQIILEAAHSSGELVVRVIDTGVGIAPEDQDRIFEPFTQVDSGTTRRFGGTGLGLSICRKIARAMGGDVSVASRLGEGACFTVRVPLKLASGPNLDDAGGPCPVVLILDPNPLNCATLKALLVPRLGDVAYVRSLEEAVREWGKYAPRVILADVAALNLEEGRQDKIDHLASCWPEARITLIAAEPFQLPESAAARGTELLLKPVSAPLIAEHLCAGRPTPAVAQAQAA